MIHTSDYKTKRRHTSRHRYTSYQYINSRFAERLCFGIYLPNKINAKCDAPLCYDYLESSLESRSPEQYSGPEHCIAFNINLHIKVEACKLLYFIFFPSLALIGIYDVSTLN